MKIYVAEFRRGSYSLTLVEVEKETPKTFSVSSSKDILGSKWIGKRINKTEASWFLARTEAINYLVKQADLYVQQKSRDLARAHEILDELKTMKESE